jgi:hypothetical protein
MSIASDNNCLWLPPDLSDLLTVSVDWDADNATVLGMSVINRAADDWLTGRLDDYTYFELLDHYGIDPFGFVGDVEEHMDLLIRCA